MSFEVNLYGLSDLIKDMRRHDQDIDEFCFSYNSIRFHAILDIGTVPFQLLLGTVSILYNTDRDVEDDTDITVFELI